MIIKRFFFLLVITISPFCYVYAQSEDGLCKAIDAIIKDAPNKFRNVRGKTIQANDKATLWECSIKVPGTIGSRFVASMGLFYEGAFFQTDNIDELKDAYEKYKNVLKNCLVSKGYTMSVSDNFYPGLSNYKKLIFMLDQKDQPETGTAVAVPPHINMEVTHSKEVGKYTIVMFILEH